MVDGDGCDARSLVRIELGIPSSAAAIISADRLNCVIPEEWLTRLCTQRRVSALSSSVYEHLSAGDIRQFLSPASSRQLPGWKRINLEVIKKCSRTVESLIEEPLCLGSTSGKSHSGMKAYVSEQRVKCLRQDAEELYRSAIHLTCGSDFYRPKMKDYNSFIQEVLFRLYSVHPVVIDNGSSRSNDERHHMTNSEVTHSTSHPGILTAYAVIETQRAFYVLQPFICYTVSDLVTFSPSKLKEDTYNTRLFILFEVLQAIRHLHSLGISIYNLSLKMITIDDQLWVRVIPSTAAIVGNLFADTVADGCSGRAPSLLESSESGMPLFNSFQSSDFSSVVQKWVYHEISNFDYLMYLNRLAGRNTNDPNHYPVLPWVIDFSSPCGNYRDLTRTKYRLNKGDEQLDLTYDVSNPESIMRGAGQTPFHISDFLSDITYYVYNARRMSKEILCKFVRPRWVPNHYPISLQRLYDWTPDECIPEFFTDPEIFVSIHDDLPDLELPPWANSAEEFVRIHREILESDEVSNDLHNWIDLTFGYKLSGIAAVTSKNICLQLVDHHKQLLNHGVVQLFNSPHPPRHQQSSLPSKDGRSYSHASVLEHINSASSMGISQPKSFLNPLAELDQLEALYEFSSRATNSLPHVRKQKQGNKRGRLQALVARDMQTIGCLIVELFMPKIWALNQPDNSLRKRYEHARQTCNTHFNDLPLCIRHCVVFLLNLGETWNPTEEIKDGLGEVFRYPSVGLDGLPPPNIDVLLHPSFGLISFPSYFDSLYTCLRRVKSLSPEGYLPDSSDVKSGTENQKVSLMTNLLTRISYKMGLDGLSLVIPHILELLNDHMTSVQCAWSLFYPVAQSLGPSASAQYLLQPLVNLFDNEDTTVKYLKIYHRSFVNQLIVRFGLNVFLNNFSTLLIEAVSGYKNFDSAGVGCHAEAFANDVTARGVTDQVDDSVVESIHYFAEDLNGEADKFLQDDVFDGDLVERDGPDEDVISVESGGHVSRDILSPALDSERKTSVNFDSLSVGSDNIATAGNVIDEAGDGDVHDSGNDSDGIFISVMPQKVNLSSDVSLAGTDSGDYNVANVAAETIKWLTHRLGPVLTTKHISRNLLRMLALCYIGEEQLSSVNAHGLFPSTTNKYVIGDKQSRLLLECLSFIATLYGEHIIQLQYLQHVKELVPTFSKNFTAKSEAGLISCLVIVLNIIPYMSDALLVDILKEILFAGVLLPLMDVISSDQLSFPSGSLARRVACYRMIDVLCIISLRIGFEATRQLMTLPIQKFFEGFSRVHDGKMALMDVEASKSTCSVSKQRKEDQVVDTERDQDREALHEVRFNLGSNQFTVDVATTRHKRQSSLGALKQHSLSPSALINNGAEDPVSNSEAGNRDRICKELRETFTPEMAHTAYIPICKLAGGIHIEQHLSNDDLIRHLCSLYDQSLMGQQVQVPQQVPDLESGSSHVTSSTDSSANTGAALKTAALLAGDANFEDSLIVEGNKIRIRRDSHLEGDQGHSRTSILFSGTESAVLRNPDMKADTRRHLRGNWLAYWEHEVGLNDRVRDFNLKQISLQSFHGHTNAIRSLHVLDNENSFISASKDRTVKLWSLRNYGDGSEKSRVGCQWTYSRHKKAVFSIVFLDSIRLVASCDGSIHIWDPFMGMAVKQINTGKSYTVSVMSALPAPSSTILTASTDSVLRFIDARCGRFSHQFRTSVVPPGVIRCTVVSPDGRTVAIGFSTGLVSTLDLRTGYLLSTWKAHEAEIIEMKSFDSRRFVTSALDQTMSIWRYEDSKPVSSVKGLTEPAHWFSFYKDTVVAGGASSKIFVGSCLESTTEVSCTKLKSDILRGNLSALAILPLNRLLMIGSDHGDIRVLA